MKIQIKSRWDSSSVLFETDAESMGLAVVAALKAKADLRGADLCGANLRGANLRDANLRDADLRGADLNKLLSQRSILPDGDLIVWKKVRTVKGDRVIKLKIPSNAKRVGGLAGRKCRAEYAVVVNGSGWSSRDSSFKYSPGKTIKPLVECSNGVHFFITKTEAEEYSL